MKQYRSDEFQHYMELIDNQIGIKVSLEFHWYRFLNYEEVKSVIEDELGCSSP